METNESNSKFLPLAVIAAGLMITGAILWNGANPSQAPSGNGETAKADIKNVHTEGDPFIGKADAPITIAFWSDFQCPFCKKFEEETLPSIIKDYVDTGKVKVVFMDFAFLGNDSITAGLYNRAVWKQYPNQYFAWRTAMYAAQDDEGDQGFGDAASIEKLTATIAGLDVAKIAADVKANEAAYKAAMESDKADGKKAGINATPAVLIGTQSVIGAYPYDHFKSVIDSVVK